MNKCKLFFKGNDLCMEGKLKPFLTELDHLKDEGGKFIRFKPSDYTRIKYSCHKQGYEIECSFNIDFNLELLSGEAINLLDAKFQLFLHQKKAYNAWSRAGYKGIVVLPTGAGKSYVGLEAISDLQLRTLIVVPTIFLLQQWKEKIIEELGVDEKMVGEFGGGKQDLKPITVITYDSASIYLKRIRDQFGLVIFDEVHHLASAPTYQMIATCCIAPYRMGLTATLNEPRDKQKKTEAENLELHIGPVVIELLPSELRKTGMISDFEIKTIEVELDSEDRTRYEELVSTYRNYIKKKGLYRSSNPIQQMVFRSGRDERANDALKAWRETRIIYQNAKNKISAVVDILRKHPDEQVLIFSESVSHVEQISRDLMVPLITHKTSVSFRKKILQAFKDGTFRIMASGKVFDEGLDVPDLSVGIIVSGTSQKRQLVQRLGRLFTKGTVEERVAARRKKGV
ncbi:MAG: DEAD/DEAH box helicase [Candidatus Hodarchaeales archaeon]